MGPWWVSHRIDATVTRQFVVKHLSPEEALRLDRPVAFTSEDLTERTYWESIQEGAKRIFLILVDIGLPDRIFAIIDAGWDDAELPLSLDDVERLQLTAARDDRVDRKFHGRQFQYLVKTIDRGEHRTYNDSDQVPLDVVDRGPPLPSKSNHVDKIRLPNIPNRTFTRRRYPLGNSSGSLPPQQFLEMVNAIKNVQNDHMVSYWASYTHQGHGFILLTPVSDFNLKSFLATPPSSFKSLPKKERRELVMDWILCLVDTMCFLHSKNRSHCYIKPSAILFTSQNSIFFVDPTRLSPNAASARADKSSFDREWYDYAAPEQWFRPTGPGSPPTRKAVLASLSASPENNGFAAAQAYGSPGGQNPASPVPNPSQLADIFSLGCIILELLSFLLKRSASKFASFRSAKLKKGGRGGAVLDTSFHKNLGQVEEWMSSLAKDAARKVSETDGGRVDGGNVFRGFTPMLHVVTEMLAASPFERPPAAEVQRRMYQILRDKCGILEPHCVNRYAAVDHHLSQNLAQMRIHDYHPPQPYNNAMQHPAMYATTQSYNLADPDMPPTPPLLHRRTTSSSGYSQDSRNSRNSRNSGSTTTGSSERDADTAYVATRGSSSSSAAAAPQPIRSPNGWVRNPSYMGPPSTQPSLYAGAP
ncbi:hypothetical protein ACO1O0_006461 [Amphichorda felina]